MLVIRSPLSFGAAIFDFVLSKVGLSLGAELELKQFELELETTTFPSLASHPPTWGLGL